MGSDVGFIYALSGDDTVGALKGKSMRAWVLQDINKISFQKIDKPAIKPRQARICVKAVGICGSDIPRIYETGAHKMPIVPGHEFSGVVESIGDGVSSYWMGKRVGIFPLIYCGKCEPCRKGMYELCRNYDYIGSRRDGAFAEYVNVPETNLIALPEEISFEEAAMMEPMAVAVNAVRKGTDGFRLDKEAKVVVCGLGTIGIFVSMFLIEAGYRNVYGIGNKQSQKERLMSLGIPEEHYLDFREDMEDEEKIKGVSTFFECVGKNETVSLGIGIAGAAGKVVLVGNPYTDMSLDRNSYWKILRNQLTVLGVWNSGFNGSFDDDWHYVLDRLKDHRIRPAEFISHRFKLSELNKGLTVMKGKTEDYCKVMITI